MSTRIEDAGEILVGKFYDVPAVKWIACKGHKPRWMPPFIPLNGPEHEDSEIIGFHHRHWHIDWRFVSQKRIESASYGRAIDPLLAAAARVINVSNTDGVIYRVKRKCLRPMPLFPSQFTSPRAPWIEELETAYEHANAKCLKCPHRGVSLVGAPIVNGARVCSGHGLAWNVETGNLQRRKA